VACISTIRSAGDGSHLKTPPQRRAPNFYRNFYHTLVLAPATSNTVAKRRYRQPATNALRSRQMPRRRSSSPATPRPNRDARPRAW
jgi:hypothetical protein